MKEIISDSKLVAYCGLYCGACKKYLQSVADGVKIAVLRKGLARFVLS